MKEYEVNFSFYSEIYGDFEEATYKVEADNQFEARVKAWTLCENDEDMKFDSNIKLCGINWNASPLDLQDYFNAQASYEKYRLQYIKNIDAPNAQISGNKESLEYYERKRYEHSGSLSSIFNISSDLGKEHSMIPPTLYDELHYAREFLSTLEGAEDYERYNAFLNEIKKAENWEPSAMINIREGFDYGHFSVGNHDYNFSSQFSKDGLCPTRASLEDRDSSYIRRWDNARDITTLNQLRFFGEKDIVAGSNTTQYSWQTLVLDKSVLEPGFEDPIYSLWIANQDNPANLDKGGDGIISAENLFTGDVVDWKRTDLVCVLRPEIAAKIDHKAIKNEYRELTASRSADEENGDEWGAET